MGHAHLRRGQAHVLAHRRGPRRTAPVDRRAGLLQRHHRRAAPRRRKRARHPTALPAGVPGPRIGEAMQNTPDAGLAPLFGRAIAEALGPRPVMVVGTADAERRANFTPAAFCAPLSYDPALVTLGLKPTSWGYANLAASGRCTLSTVAAAAAPAVVFCGSHSGRTTDKSAAFATVWEDGLPRPADALAAFSCRLVSDTPTGDHRLLVLEVMQAAARPSPADAPSAGPADALLCLAHDRFAHAEPIN
ncbi:hypothetical protein GMI70_01210 [Eggerthellaceae bacterium zg-893]|nr:hypothetical protein [Eggerthellaceae bacterium zg-893]